MKLSALTTVLATLALAPACGDAHDLPPDAAGPCWPLPSTPGGSIAMGTGDVDWQPMPDTVEIVRNGAQSDPYLYVHARITGMPPGDANDFLNPDNPHTIASLVIEETGLTLGLECPATMGYLPAPEAGAYDLLHSLRLGFGFTALTDVEGKHAHITIQVVGANGLYASDEKTVVLKAPPSL